MSALDKIVAFVRRDGSRTFVCRECGYTVHAFADFDGDGLAVCRTCQFIGEHPQLPADARELLRGETPPPTADCPLPNAGEQSEPSR